MNCRTCPGMENLSQLHDCERIVIQGWRYPKCWRWIVDVITPEAAGHANEAGLDDAINEAIRQAMGMPAGD